MTLGQGGMSPRDGGYSRTRVLSCIQPRGLPVKYETVQESVK